MSNLNQFYTLPSPAIFEVSGRDSVRYLNARLTNDVRMLTPGQAIRAAQLNAQGRTEGVFVVISLQEVDPGQGGKFLLVSEGGNHSEIMEAFKRFIVADRVEISDWSQSAKSLFLFGDPTPVVQQLNRPFPETIVVPTVWPGLKGSLIVATSLESGAHLVDTLKGANFEAMRDQQFLLCRLQSGVPFYPTEILPSRPFLESQQREAISFRKGCYVGQEVMEKIDAFGTVPRLLMRIESASELKEGQDLFDSAGTAESLGTQEVVGKVLSAIFDATLNRWLAFVSLKQSVANDGHVLYDSKASEMASLGTVRPLAGVH